MAVIVGAVGVALVYGGVTVTLFFPDVRKAATSTTATLSTVGGLTISVVTGTFLRESRLAQRDLAQQLVHMQAHIREIRRERKGLETLTSLAAGTVKTATGARISQMLVSAAAPSTPDLDTVVTGSSQAKKGSRAATTRKRKAATKVGSRPEPPVVDLEEGHRVDEGQARAEG
jgi:hypothetical protein